jgi:hypothetical protein
MGLDVAIALVLPKPRANVYSFPDNVCNLNNLPISDEIAVSFRNKMELIVRKTCGRNPSCASLRGEFTCPSHGGH